MSTAQTSLPDVSNLAYVEQMYAEYIQNPEQTPADWRQYFADLANGEPESREFRLGPTFHARSIFNPAGGTEAEVANEEHVMRLQHRVDRLIRAYRVRGHIQSKIDPLTDFTPYVPELDPQYYGFTDEDMDRLFVCETMKRDGRLRLSEIIDRLRKTYTGSIGTQFMHIDDLKARHWLQERIEGLQNRTELARQQQLRILTRLTDAVVFEQFIRKKFVGAKSFSLEGAESLIPLLDLAIEKAGEQGVEEIVMAMAHRGRLNVLANIIGKSPREIFREFEDKDPDLSIGGGDVKYHMGYSSDYVTGTGRQVHLSLCFNPSHLEFVNPVALGRVRAKQDRRRDDDRAQVMTLLIHGDAAFIAEGVTQESLNLARLPGYRTGGTVHVIVNNQIGFTTPPSEGRSTMYATSVAKMLPIPILHVNGENPDAVARCIELAMDFRQRFRMDVIIDMYCYRRLGHNEGDEPSFTQPLLYKMIEDRKSVRDGYLEHLLKLGEVSREEADEIAEKRHDLLEKHLTEARGEYSPVPDSLRGIWQEYTGGNEPADDDPDTGVAAERLGGMLEKLTQFPEQFHPHPKLKRALEQRREMARGERPLDWAAGEALAFASLAVEGHRLRLSGQDSARGTFSHRHAVLHDVENGKLHVPLQHLDEHQGPVEIINSPLSETGVLGFDYGYSLDCPDGLVIWEAQFGDFVNAAQVIIDQFISSGEDKWRRLSGLVLLLPHGFEGMGPEHSSARLERFLSLAAEDNMQVVVPSTPAQFFHLLRRQVVRRWRKPLIVMTPKSMLRHPQAVSALADCATGPFRRVLPDTTVEAGQVQRVLLCSGKLYYDLLARREASQRHDVAIVRLEQLYPLPRTELEEALARYAAKVPVVWVQEEPENMGAWRFLRAIHGPKLLDKWAFTGICRPASASPATGSANAHKIEQEEILEAAFTEGKPPAKVRVQTIVGTKNLEAPNS